MVQPANLGRNAYSTGGYFLQCGMVYKIMNHNITKAVIALAGYGTRRLPITKAVEKCMMPVENRPIIDYIVDDCIKAGITDIIFVVGEQSDQIRTYYGKNEMLEAYLAENNKVEALQEVTRLRTKARFQFIVQDHLQPYGTSIPVWLAKDCIGPGESFVFLYGDNIHHTTDGSSVVKYFLQEATDAGKPSAMLVAPVPRELVSRYGIVETTSRDGVEIYEKTIEKPRPEETTSDLNNAGCFLLSDDIFPFVERSITHSPQSESFIIDAVNWYSQAGNDVLVVRSKGEYLDCGSVDGWLQANNRIVRTIKA